MRSLLVCFVLLCSFARVLAIDAVVSHTLFYIADPTRPGKLLPRVDVYWQINPRTLHYTTTPEKTIVAHVKVNITFSNDAGIIKQDEYVLQTTPRTTASELAKNTIIDLRQYILVPGMVKMKFTLTDEADNKNHFFYADSINVTHPEDSVFYSGLELLDTTIQSTVPSPFKKNNQQQLPACTNFLDDARHVLHYYAEIYQSDKIQDKDYPLTQNVFIAKKEDAPGYGAFMNTDTIAKGKQLSTAFGSFDIRGLISGNYYLRITLENKMHDVIASEATFFQRLNNHPYTPADTSVTAKKTKEAAKAKSDTGMEQVTLIDLNKTFVKKYSFVQVKDILKMLLPVSDANGAQTIRGFLKKPDELYMRYFIYNYFASINKKDPNEAAKEYFNKVIDVNQKFRSHGTPGYATDRGFIYLRYGPPTDIISVPNEPGAQPYEIWQYNVLTQTNRVDVANALFLFYQPQGTFDFTLLHGTVEGEKRDPNWRKYLYSGAGSGSAGSGNSRAEEYIGTR